MTRKKIIFGMFFVFVILFLQFISADIISNVQTSQFNLDTKKSLDTSLCQEGKDFLVQISPSGCEPAVVRTDLLEEEDVQVYCKLGATQINPLIDVQTIDSISFSGTYPKEVSSIGFHPAKAALGVKGDLNSPVLNNIGYVVINLKKQANASAIPEFVEGKLTAKIKYNVKSALGIGNAQIYVSDLDNADWEARRYQYNFWNGKGTLKSDGIGTDNAQISVYSNEKKISSVSLKKGETSSMIYLPGLECQAGTKLKLDGLESPNTRAIIRVNAEVAEIAEGEKFLDNKCSVKNLEYRGINQHVDIRCIEDGKTSEFGLSINPKITLKLAGKDLGVITNIPGAYEEATRDYSVGDWLYDTTYLGNPGSVYLAYIGTDRDSKNVDDLFIYLTFSLLKKEKLSEEEISTASALIGDLKEAGQTSTGYIDITSDAISRFAGLLNGIGRAIEKGEYYWRLNFGENHQVPEISGPTISIVNLAGATDAELTGNAKEYYDGAKADYETIRESYSSETYTKDETSTFGEEAFYNEILLAWNANQKKFAYDLCQEYIQAYPNSKKDLSYCTDAIKLANQDAQEVYVTINGEIKTISFDGINEPTFEDFGATVRINAPDGTVRSFDLKKNTIVYLDKNQEIYAVHPIIGGVVYFKYSNGWSWSYDKVTWVISPDANSATQLINQLKGKTLDDGKTTLINQGAVKETMVINDYLQLNSLDDNSATIRTNLNVYGLSETIAKEFSGGIITLQKDVPKDLGTGYVFTLTDINLKKVAKVSVLPNINNAGTTADFSFKIGIEKRAINLPPEQVRNLITTLNKTINDWEGISSTLGGVTQGLQTGCLAAGAALVAKNFLFGVGGEGIARQTIMRGSNGWTERCAQLVAQGTYNSQDQCYLSNADKIDKDVVAVSGIIEQQNSKIKQIESGITQAQFLTESIVNTTAFMEKYTPQVRSCLGNQNYADPSGKGTAITTDDLNAISYENWKVKQYFNKEQLRDIELYCNILKSPTASAELKQIANQRIYSELTDVKTNVGNLVEIVNLASRFGVSSSDITFIETGQNVRKFKYEGLTNGNRIPTENSNAPIAIISASDGGKYILLLDDSAGTQQLPVLGAYSIIDGSKYSEIPSELKNIYFQRFDATTYQNEYKNAQLRYYETEPYKGLPAIVPFDLKNGWYAATRQTLPTGGSIQPYDASARPNSFYLCNVGENGLEEFQTIGDDTCEMINLGTGMSYDQFPGLDERDAKTQIDKAVQAITQASKLYRAGLSGKVNILGNSVSVGSPAADIPQFQCQDFMSPNECLVLFNLCDPVICPSSRCDLGGAYPVKDVVQTGVIGSLVLCLPNVQEGIIFPVCLTGVKAGIDGFLSITKSYRDCLQESLRTGKVVGVCDEIYSLYICDFFWRQALPLTDIAIPKIVEFLSGQGTRGGGEYASVQNSWNSAESAISFFTNYYGANAKDAFLARTTETVKSEVCKSYTSAVVPSGADFINQITTPASPVQFTARFDEIPLTTATVPPTSHYKVFYHIFAGKDSGAYYQVYLKGTAGSSYYQDASQNLAIASGYISVGGYATETKDLTAVAGYNQLCVNVNGQEECGFKEVSTDFAINYLKDEYLASQATETDITTEAGCISGSASVYSILTNPNVQQGAEETINPEIYNRGITRICATDNPGIGTDTSPYVATKITGGMITGKVTDTETDGNIPTDDSTPTPEPTPTPTETTNDEEPPTTIEEDKKIIEELTKEPGVKNGPRWVAVGYCDNEKIKCWLDTESVKDVIKTTTIEGEALQDVQKNYMDVLRNEGNYLSEKEFSSSVQEIEKEKNSAKKITIIDNIFDRTFWSTEKVQLIFLRGNAYMELLKLLIGTQPKPETTTTTASTELSNITDARQRVLVAAEKLTGAIVTIPRSGFLVCGAAALKIYSYAQVSYKCVYGDKEASYLVYQQYFNKDSKVIVNVPGKFSPYAGCPLKPISQKFDNIKPGDYLVRIWDSKYNHGVIFLGWEDKGKRIARLFDWNGDYLKEGEKDSQGKICTRENFFRADTCTGGGNNYCTYNGNYFCKTYWTYTSDLTDAAGQPVYMVHSPDTSGIDITTTEIGKDISPAPPTEFTSGYSPAQPTKTTVGDKIYSEAAKLLGSSYVSSAEFVSRSLINAGVSSLGIRSFEELIHGFETPANNFMEIDPDYMKAGDIIVLGKECLPENSIGIFADWDLSTKQAVFYTQEKGLFDDGKVVQKRESVSNILTLNNNVYVSRAYRYIGNLTAEEKSAIIPSRATWIILSALNKISPPYSGAGNPLTGNYDENKQFIDELIIDGLLTEQECKDVRGNQIFGANMGQKDINWVKNILVGKQSGMQAESIGAD
ncbi:MAG: hypothetical protein PHQ66_00955 [Candidatus Nanoarchaeia archaeon]|nr:hypothetical protein [Candidatus Nanoarchaeia archaeon]MDD5358049.1 hypothetical protein [Candidatus Nanoarchaeia archaeon]MDD5588968.1 hypothetical protein [Candidatus Nanoarchaeia archaeon]